MMKFLKSAVFLTLLLALFLRIYKLPDLPVGFHADEIRVGWNAYSLLKTGADDWGNSFPLHYNTFGDFRPTGYFYLTIPFLAVLGPTELAVRLPGALAGALTVVVLYYFVREISQSQSKKKRFLDPALLSALLLSLSPWHISLSRATSEGIVAVFLTITGLWLLVKGIKSQNKKHLALSLLFLLSSYLFYHSARLLVPVLTAMTLWYFLRPTNLSSLRQLPRYIFIVLAILAGTTFLFGLSKEAKGRFTQVSIFHDLDVKFELEKMPFEEGPGNVFIARAFHNKPSVYARRFLNEYTQYISAKFFLVPKEAKPARYQTVGLGILTYIEFALLLLGLVYMAKGKVGTLPLWLLLLSPIPGALTTEDSPNLHRALYMAPFISVIAGFGLYYLSTLKKHTLLATRGAFTLLLLNFVFFAHQYLTHNPVNNPLYRNVGAKELALKLNDIYKEYDKVLITNIPDSPYPWVAFFTRQDPKTFNEKAKVRAEGAWESDNLVFTSGRCPSRDAFKKDSSQPQKLLVVDAEACETEAAQYNYGPDVTIRDQIRRPDGTIVYTLWSRQ